MKKLYLLIICLLAATVLRANDGNDNGEDVEQNLNEQFKQVPHSSWSIHYGAGASQSFLMSARSSHQPGFSEQLGVRLETNKIFDYELSLISANGSDEVYTPHLSTLIKDYSSNPGTGGVWWMPIEYKSLGAELSLLYNVYHMDRFKPYVYVGAGVIYCCKDFKYRDGSVWAFSPYVGIKPTYKLNRHFGLFADVKLRFLKDKYYGFLTKGTLFQLNYNLGVSLFL